jgi:hypothetical protein
MLAKSVMSWMAVRKISTIKHIDNFIGHPVYKLSMTEAFTAIDLRDDQEGLEQRIDSRIELGILICNLRQFGFFVIDHFILVSSSWARSR